jgi:hypothetical protein
MDTLEQLRAQRSVLIASAATTANWLIYQTPQEAASAALAAKLRVEKFNHRAGLFCGHHGSSVECQISAGYPELCLFRPRHQG